MNFFDSFHCPENQFCIGFLIRGVLNSMIEMSTQKGLVQPPKPTEFVCDVLRTHVYTPVAGTDILSIGHLFMT
ncbi:hypothetical protein NECAME_13151 [Necator americanus]|uniref:Uncharacterized protein n=1 Tax=Necator americanus TaxID=51031 RepID=W2SXB6_NECAM|nr:hypothetical protein NECAME_13151 [Necator americanus]ETN74188.1 hypothetical protein NECAME_13151 [Necator americanus]